jgi:hypothetical protein
MKDYTWPLVFVAALLLLAVACASAPSEAQDAPGKAVPGGVEKYDMPYGFPAAITYCLYGTRLFESYTQGGSNRTSPAIGLTSRADDPSCPK